MEYVLLNYGGCMYTYSSTHHFAITLCRALNGRQDGGWYVEEVKQVLVPLLCLKVHQHRPTCVSDVCDMNTSFSSSREILW